MTRSSPGSVDWRASPPTVPGWYWWQPTYSDPEVVHVWEAFQGGGLMCFRTEHRMGPVPQCGRWAGPIPLPGGPA